LQANFMKATDPTGTGERKKKRKGRRVPYRRLSGKQSAMRREGGLLYIPVLAKEKKKEETIIDREAPLPLRQKKGKGGKIKGSSSDERKEGPASLRLSEETSVTYRGGIVRSKRCISSVGAEQREKGERGREGGSGNAPNLHGFGYGRRKKIK